jgi:DNA-binding GntR family transcriptional regulator
MPLPRQTAYGQIADLLRAEILAGDYEPTDDNPRRNELPGAAELGARFGVSGKTAGRAVQQLIAEGLVTSRPGLRPIVVPRRHRPARWPMNRRYARAREARGLVFGADMQGREVQKPVVSTGNVPAPAPAAALLRIEPGQEVWARARQALIDDRVGELSVSYLPLELAERTVLTTPGQFPPGGMVAALESTGHRVTWTANEARARLATDEELQAFGPDPALAPLHSRIVIEIMHATYGADDEPLEVVISVRPAEDNVIVFETYEGPEGDDQDDELATEPDGESPSGGTSP